MKRKKRKRQDKQFVSLPCFYGNWCGIGCSGPKPPIDDLDNCCKKHDRCYRRYGKFSSKCDNKMLKCLRQKINLKTEKGRKALLMYKFLKFRSSTS